MIDKYTVILPSDITLRKAMYKVYDGKCFYTGRQIHFEDLHVDHIKPKSMGGDNCISNYVLSSGYINRAKKGRYNETFGKVIKEINDLLFADKVVAEYINIELNNSILKGMYPIDKYVKKGKLTTEDKRKIVSVLKKRGQSSYNKYGNNIWENF